MIAVASRSMIQAYAERIEIRQDGRLVGDHPRCFGRGRTIYDPWNYVPVLVRKPGALRNGAPFKDWVLPGAMEKVRRKLKGVDDGDRQMVDILATVLTEGLPAVEAACAEDIAQSVHSADVILNILARRRDSSRRRNGDTRSGEVRGATWEEIDLKATPVWTIPASRMKAKREHRVPLSARAVDILRQSRALGDGTGLVFPGTKSGKALSDMTLSKLVKELGFAADIHGFRTSFRTWAQERTNFPREVAEAALAHTIKDKAEAAYARSDLFERRHKMMGAWAAYIAGGTAEIVKLGQKAK